ncbi:MAG: phage holin family protein [Candidatus Accumulibacter sp. UW20]|jgi:uncharacterized membrane protein YqjE
MSESPGRVSGGFVQASRNSAATLLASGRTRLELLGNELREEKLRAIRLAIASLLVILCLVLAIILAVALLVVVYWDNRVPLLAGLSALFLAACVFLYLPLRRSLRSGRPLFAASIDQLGEDLRHLKGVVRNESKAD